MKIGMSADKLKSLASVGGFFDVSDA